MLPKAWTQEQRCSRAVSLWTIQLKWASAITLCDRSPSSAPPELSPQSCPHATTAALTQQLKMHLLAAQPQNILAEMC